MPPYYRPCLDYSGVIDLVKSAYGLDVTVVSELVSYLDQNFRVQLVSSSGIEGDAMAASVPQYVLKVNNSLESKEAEVIEAQTEMMLHAKHAAFPCPGLLPTLDNKHQTLMDVQVFHPEGPRKEKCVVRLLEYITGITLNDDEVTLNPDLCYEIGSFAGRLDVIFKSFPSDRHPCLQQMNRTWSPQCVPLLVSRLHALQDPEQVKVCREVIQNFEVKVVQRHDKFMKGHIHADVSDCNILVRTQERTPTYSQSIDADLLKFDANLNNTCQHQTSSKSTLDKTEESNFHLSGLIDFGHVTYSMYIFEIAVAIAYAMVKACAMEPVQVASCVLAGYLQHMDLPQDELKVLKLSICARLVQTFVIGYSTILEDPNNEYILICAKHVWPILKQLWATQDDDFLTQVIGRNGNANTITGICV